MDKKTRLTKVKAELVRVNNSISYIKDPNMVLIMRYLIPALQELVREVEDLEKEFEEENVENLDDLKF